MFVQDSTFGAELMQLLQGVCEAAACACDPDFVDTSLMAAEQAMLDLAGAVCSTCPAITSPPLVEVTCDVTPNGVECEAFCNGVLILTVICLSSGEIIAFVDVGDQTEVIEIQ